MPARWLTVMVMSLPPALGGFVCDATEHFDGSITYDGICQGTYEGAEFMPGRYSSQGMLFSGTLPSELADLSDTLQVVWLGECKSPTSNTLAPHPRPLILHVRISPPTANNAISGTIPEQWGQLTGLTELILLGDRLSGTIPASLGNIPNLATGGLELYGNNISGTVPANVYLDPALHPVLVSSPPPPPRPTPSAPRPPLQPPQQPPELVGSTMLVPILGAVVGAVIVAVLVLLARHIYFRPKDQSPNVGSDKVTVSATEGQSLSQS